MDKRLKNICIGYVVAFVIAIGYTVYMAIALDPSETIALLFIPFAAVGWLLFIVSLAFIIIYFKHLKKLWAALLPVFLISSVVPIYFFIHLDRFFSNKNT